MSVFNAIIKSLRSNIVNIAVYFVIFAIFGNISASATATTTDNVFEEKTMKVAVKDYDNSPLSKALISYLEETQEVVDPQTDDPVEMNDSVRFLIYDYVIIIPEGFAENLEKESGENTIKYIAPGATASEYLLTEKISDFLGDVVIYMENGYTEEEAISLTKEQMLEISDKKATVMDTSDENHRSFYTGMFTFNAYSLTMILCICVGTCLLFLKEKDVSNRISVSGMHFKKRNLAIIGAVLLIGFVVTTCMIITIQIMGLSYANEKLIFYAMNAYVLMVVSLGLAFLFSTIAKEENLINMLSNMLVLSMCFLSGVFVDKQFLSPAIVKAAHFLPLYWYTVVVEFINDTPFEEVLCEKFFVYMLIELLFALVFFMAGLIISRKKEQYAV